MATKDQQYEGRLYTQTERDAAVDKAGMWGILGGVMILASVELLLISLV